MPARPKITTSNPQNHPWAWLLAIVFGAGGAGTAWVGQHNELERLRDQVSDLKAVKADLLNQVAALNAEAKLKEKSLVDAQTQVNRCSGNTTINDSTGVALHDSSVTIGSSSSGTAKGN